MSLLGLSLLNSLKCRLECNRVPAEECDVKTCVKQEDGLSLMFFNVVLEKVIRQWKTTNDSDGDNKDTLWA